MTLHNILPSSRALIEGVSFDPICIQNGRSPAIVFVGAFFFSSRFADASWGDVAKQFAMSPLLVSLWADAFHGLSPDLRDVFTDWDRELYHIMAEFVSQHGYAPSPERLAVMRLGSKAFD